MNAIVLDPKSSLGDSSSYILGYCDPYTPTTPFVPRSVNSDNERCRWNYGEARREVSSKAKTD